MENKSRRKKKNTVNNHSLKRLAAVLLLLLGFGLFAPQLLPELLSSQVVTSLEQEFPEARDLHRLADAIADTGSQIGLSGNQNKLGSDKTASAPLPSGSTSAGSPLGLPQDGSLRVDFLDVGQGLSVLVEADGHYLLYDGGDRSASSFVVAYLKERNVEKLDYLIASHYDADHINGLVGALHVFEVDQIFGPDYTADSKVYHSLVTTVSDLGKEITSPEIGGRYPIGNGYFEVLSPLSAHYEDVNNYSIAIRLVYGDTSFLFSGDAEEDSEAEMLEAWPDLKSDVLCIGHHGSPTSSGKEFLERVSPEYAIISCGKDNAYNHPAPSVLERLKKQQITYWRTDESGTITAAGNGISLDWSAEQGLPVR